VSEDRPGAPADTTSATLDRAGFGREEVIATLAAFGDRAARDVREEIGSLELTWLIAKFEERYAVTVELGDEELARVHTVADAVDVLRATLGLPPEGPEKPEGAVEVSAAIAGAADADRAAAMGPR
jgi:hypothetical protein